MEARAITDRLGIIMQTDMSVREVSESGEPTGWTGIVVGWDGNGYPLITWTGIPKGGNRESGKSWDPEFLEVIEPEFWDDVATPKLAVRLIFTGGGEVTLPCPSGTVRPATLYLQWLKSFLDGHPDILAYDDKGIAYAGFVEL